MSDKDYSCADPKHPFVGLDNHNCRHPKHWCACHQVWLSESDARMRGCRHRNKNDGPCECFLPDQYKKSINSMLRKTRKTTCKGSKRYY